MESPKADAFGHPGIPPRWTSSSKEGVVGGATAGTNGNVARVAVRGGFTVMFTGMRVTRHDGEAPHHLVGVRPDIRAAPTVVGLRAGRDEVLERGLAVARGAAEGVR